MTHILQVARAQRKMAAWVVSALLTVSLMPVGLASASAESNDIFDSDAVLVAVRDELEANPAVELSQSELSVSAIENGASEEGSTAAAGIVVDAAVPESLTTAASEAGAHVSDEIQISIPFATKVIERSSDTVVAATVDDTAAVYIQPTEQGVRLMTVLADRSAPTSYSYEFNVPEGTTARETADGRVNLVDSEGLSVGTVRAPWARDVNGLQIPTTYSWSDGELTQRVDLADPRIAFPVVADPAWDYTVGWLIETKTVSQVRNMLYGCFNCYFPVHGAPASFPTYNQFLPLQVGPAPGIVGWNFNCYFDGHSYENEGNGWAWFYYRFRSAASHVDGLGSTIEFSFNPAWKQSNPNHRYTELVVYAWIQNDNPMGIGRPACVAGAWYNWGAFAGNLRTG